MKKTLTLFTALVFCFSCSDSNTNTDPKPSTEAPPSVAGVYTGTIQEENKWANPASGYHESDTTYEASFKVELLNADSIKFICAVKEWKFKLDSSNYYMEWYGTHSNRTFDINSPDSLKYSFWTYGGNGTSFSQTNVSFKGRKNQ
ncbi:MAG: hypothetical protein LPJ89_08300 [Hymenobacteraceae bacterium]|nr:hypothetical protein [Hymenobacteraceae bacterium]MDX5397441.1 hypothetical protein [Hymenobacteraceae bacterium]MDX5443765.1 hypothetical protein [Hymenobacteraceae bacterium]MDX5513519.1 hypothetical protein [Hymenobacteraceae bacterium]